MTAMEFLVLVYLAIGTVLVAEVCAVYWFVFMVSIRQADNKVWAVGRLLFAAVVVILIWPLVTILVALTPESED